MSIIGANGAGKSTLLKAIVGLVQPMRGDIRYDGASIGATPAHKRVANGIALVPEGRRIFPSLTVEENIVIGGDVGRPGRGRSERVLEAFPLLARLLKRPAKALSGGERQTLAIARALMANPRLLLLDEVSLGLAPIVVRQVYEAVPVIKAAGHHGVDRRAGRQPGAGRRRPLLLPARGSHRPQRRARRGPQGADHARPTSACPTAGGKH